MNYGPILEKLDYWKNYNGSGDEYRSKNDHDCILTGGNLMADTIFSLWLPLRYVLNYFNTPKWIAWKEYEANTLKKKGTKLKNCKAFVEDFKRNIELFLPEDDMTCILLQLFKLGQRRCNVMLLPFREWNSKRGGKPYFDYLPHFLYDLLDDKDLSYKDKIVDWIQGEHLTMFFKDGVIDREHIFDLAGTGCVYSHSPEKISLSFLLRNYVRLLEERERIMVA